MAFAAPVVRDRFIYDGDLYVNVGKSNRHKRASVAEIAAILRPDLMKPKASIPIKDPVGHWYEAQLIHYGLPPSKDKARAKMRLLDNLNKGNLKVPAEIAAMEIELEREFTAAERRVKAQLKTSFVASEASPTRSARDKKRKASDSYSQSPSMSLDSTIRTALSPHGDDSALTKKRKVQTQNESVEQPASNVPANQTPRQRPIQTARKQTSRRGGYSSQYRSLSTLRTSSMKRDPKPTVKNEPKVKSQSKARKELKDMQNSNTPVPRSSAAPPLGLINGTYSITCPEIEMRWNHDDELTLTLALDTGGVWGAYDFGMFSGILHIAEHPVSASDQVLPLRWRGRDNNEEGYISFGDDNRGGISFLGHGNIEGWMSLYGRCRFTGTRLGGPETSDRSAQSMRDEWAGYNQRQYDWENRSRWGSGKGGWY